MDTITLKQFTEPILEYGMSSYQKARMLSGGEYENQVGVKSTSVLLDLGVFFIAFVLVVFLFIIFLIVKFCARRVNCCKSVLAFFKKYLFYTMPIRLVIEGFLRTLSIFAALLVLSVFREKGELEFIKISLYGTFVTILFLWPLFIIVFVMRNEELIGVQSF